MNSSCESNHGQGATNRDDGDDDGYDDDDGDGDGSGDGDVYGNGESDGDDDECFCRWTPKHDSEMRPCTRS